MQHTYNITENSINNIVLQAISKDPHQKILKKKKKACFLAAEAPGQMLCNTSLSLFVRKA